MKTKNLSIIVAAVTLLTTVQVWAYVVFETDGTIEDGDVYDYVYVRNDAVVDMTGGVVTHLLGAEDFSIVNISGGSLHRLGCVDISILNLSGDMQANELEVLDSGTLNMLGGSIGLLEVGSFNATNLHCGTISDYLLATSTVNVYGYGFEYDPLAGNYQGGQLTGFWLDGTPFSIDLYYDDTPGGPVIDTWSHIVLIPEPATILLLALGGIMLRKRD